MKESVEHYRKARRGLENLASGDSGRATVHPQYVANIISRLTSDDAIFTFDVGTPVVRAARYIRMNGKRRLVGSLADGSMAVRGASYFPLPWGRAREDPGFSVNARVRIPMLLRAEAGVKPYQRENIDFPFEVEVAEKAQ